MTPLPQSTPSASLSRPRAGHTATLLNDGRVLVVGGKESASAYLSSAEIYDPLTNRWTSVTPLARARAGHTATVMRDGRVLVAGGQDNDTSYLAAAELYDPETDRWSPVEPMGSTRAFHTATLLPNGRILVAGGRNEALFHATVEVYDPGTQRWAHVGRLEGVRMGHTASLIGGGQLLITGGDSGAGLHENTAELLALGSYGASSVEPMAYRRGGHTATGLTRDGQVLVVGGYFAEARGGAIIPVLPQVAERFDPATRRWSPAGSLKQGRTAHAAVELSDGRVMVVGGQSLDEYMSVVTLSSAEIFDPATNTWTELPPLARGRNGHTATTLANGQVLVVGGQAGDEPLTSVERYDPATNSWATGR
jgi:N-acetylneuraminic acid mutarotase